MVRVVEVSQKFEHVALLSVENGLDALQQHDFSLYTNERAVQIGSQLAQASSKAIDRAKTVAKTKENSSL
jgi:hypothetical protein